MNLKMALFQLLCALVAGVGIAHGLPGGPPVSGTPVCSNLIPASSSPHVKQNGNIGYTIYTNLVFNSTTEKYMYTAGETYTVTILSGSTPFRGFLMQAWDPSNTRIGTFNTTSNQQQLLDCSGSSIPQGATIAHSNSARADFTTQTFNWTAPSPAGYVDLMYTIVPEQSRYYGPLSAAEEKIAAQPTLTAPTRMPNDYRTILRSPDNCAVSDCTVFVGIDTNAGNDDYLDVYMEAAADAWVAVGFSETASMFDADVLACNYNSDTSMVEALDTWNLSPPTRNNIIDNVQDVSLFSGSFANGRITCTLARKTAGSDVPTQDLNLDAKYYLLYGRGMIRSAGSLLTHGTTNVPQISTGKINVADNAAISGTTPLLLALFVATCIALFFKV